ncbi:phosphatase [Vibrio sp. qd031]|uniref:cyclin-dependent kinase inhibitor 3 family protein n=1 Tax=Vibrio sp. qd031 TaxID=1603038 RepID=UPI000A100B35|nr:cyclin-dependent kinase inhibitor 3 family protein [Vibrio sp. qd031]ORT51748.1 phosphatase [Vibrio sp. qd031]
MTHPTWQLNVDDGALILTPCPGTKELDLDASLAQLKQDGVTVVATALSHEEMNSKGVSSLGEQVKALDMSWLHLPIEDDCAPGDSFSQQWADASPVIQQALNNGEKVAMHCMGGSGRTGLLAANALLERDWPLAKIKTDVQALRPGAFTKPVQIDYVDTLAKTFK